MKNTILLLGLTSTAVAVANGFEYRPFQNDYHKDNIHDLNRFSLLSQDETAAEKKPKPLRNEQDYCLIFEDHFDKFDLKNWQHEITLSGGGNWEFQYYTNNRSNSFVEDGILYLKPTMTEDKIGINAMKNGGKMNLYSGSPSEDCTDNSNFGCERMSGQYANGNIINPIQSARLRTINSVSLKYGKVEVRARLPKGDYLWPAIWLLPSYSAYGSWPASGEIDIMESKGNKVGKFGNSSTILSTLHWGPNSYLNKYYLTQDQMNVGENEPDFTDKFHTYGLEWNSEALRTYVDDQVVLQVDFDTPAFERGNFQPTTDNPWEGGDISAPFDQEFYLILNLAVGGVNNYWPDEDETKPWRNDDEHAPNAFYNAKNEWLPTWGQGNTRALAIDWVKMWSLNEQGNCSVQAGPK